MKKIALPALLFTLLAIAACSALVTADRSKIKDDMYSPTPDAGTAAGPDSGTDSGSTDEKDAGDGEDAGVP